jgi:hypothetical protein
MAGVFEMLSESLATVGRFDGQFVLFSGAAGLRLVGYTIRVPTRDTSDLGWIDVPITFTSSGDVATNLGVDLLGRVRGDTGFILTPRLTPGGAAFAWRVLGFLREPEDAASLLDPTGAYSLTGSRGTTRWSGSAALVRAPVYKPARSPGENEYLGLLRIEARGDDNQELFLSLPCFISGDGTIVVRQPGRGARGASAAGSFAAGQLSLTIDLPLGSGSYVLRTTLRGAKLTTRQ